MKKSANPESKLATPARRKRIFAKKRPVIVTDSEGGLPLPVEWVLEMGLKIGDEFASWKAGEKIMLVFTKVYRGKIPKQAHRGKIEPALRESREARRAKSQDKIV